MKFTLQIFVLSLIFTIFSCKNESQSSVKYHKSHEESRKNVPFSDAVQIDNLFFLTGQIGKNHKTGKMAEGGIEEETKQAILNIKQVLEQHQLTLKDVVKCTVILSDINDFEKMNKIYRSFFTENLPARTTFAANLVANAKIEIEVVAVKK